MRDYTTNGHINPVIEEITEKYYIETAYNKYLDCDLLLKSASTNDAYIVRKSNDFYLNIKSIKQLIKDINDYANYAATYEGELYLWSLREINRALNAIRDTLILKFGETQEG